MIPLTPSYCSWDGGDQKQGDKGDEGGAIVGELGLVVLDAMDNGG